MFKLKIKEKNIFAEARQARLSVEITDMESQNNLGRFVVKIPFKKNKTLMQQEIKKQIHELIKGQHRLMEKRKRFTAPDPSFLDGLENWDMTYDPKTDSLEANDVGETEGN